MGKSLAEYEESVGAVNKQFHETAESLVLHKEGVLPLRRDDDETPDIDTGSGSTKRRRPTRR